MNHMKIIYSLLFILLCSPIHAEDVFTTEDIYSIKDITLSDVSEDGNGIVFITSQAENKYDGFKNTLYFLDTHKGKKVKLLESYGSKGMNFSSIKFSSNSKSIFFLSSGMKTSGKESNQIWSLSLSNRVKRKVTNFDGDISDYDVSDDGKTIAFIGQRSSDKKADTKTPSPIVIDRYQFKRDYEGFLGPNRDHLFIFDTQSRKVEQITSGQKDHLYPSISPNGENIAYMTKEGDFDRHNNWEIFIKNIKGEESHRKLLSNNGEDISTSYPSRPEWSPDGEKIAYLHGGDHSMLWYALQEVSIIDVETGDIDFITQGFDRNTSLPQWSGDGQNIFFILEDNMKSQLMKYSLLDNTTKKITPDNMYLSGYAQSYHVTDDEIIFQSSTSEIPSEIYHLKEDQINPITSVNEQFIKNKLIGSTELISFQSFDGLTINGMMIKPPNFDSKKKYPLMIRIHGGPVSQYGRYFDFDWQLFASNNYVVIVTNPRGSSGRGFEFQKSIFAEWGIEDSKDISAALDFALDLGYIDENKLGIGGWSYGGMLTNYVIAKDNRFHAATSGAGISNILSGFGHDHYIREYIIELGTPWDNLDAWLNVSHPFLSADEIVTPTLFLVGEKDWNVPLIGSEQMYQALKHLEIPTQLIIYPNEHHGLSKPSYIKDRLDRYLDWHGKYPEK
ncbi:MAG: S9 family peptidase [Gammaproteobacteria bacterium]|nr:MAG: S9 family peptidase [Gammaproteobacteria bacterium]